jgi:hypothetical protein
MASLDQAQVLLFARGHGLAVVVRAGRDVYYEARPD